MIPQKETRVLTDKEIEEAKKRAPKVADGQHEHNDCIRIAYEWLDAQKKTRNPTTKDRQFKHIIESWGERYVSTDDVQVAAWLHPEIKGKYPRFNIGKRLTLPSKARLGNIEEAGKHPSYGDRYQDVYDNDETSIA